MRNPPAERGPQTAKNPTAGGLIDSNPGGTPGRMAVV